MKITCRQDAGATTRQMDNVTKRGRGYLPHWESEGGRYFVTFRLADSLPQSLLESIEFERRDILKTAEQQGRALTAVERKRLSELFSARIHRSLDAGAGDAAACIKAFGPLPQKARARDQRLGASRRKM